MTPVPRRTRFLTAPIAASGFLPVITVCPDMNDQEKIFDLLKPGAIGIKLTEGQMMDPEASISALVFHHQQARYFTIET